MAIANLHLALELLSGKWKQNDLYINNSAQRQNHIPNIVLTVSSKIIFEKPKIIFIVAKHVKLS